MKVLLVQKKRSEGLSGPLASFRIGLLVLLSSVLMIMAPQTLLAQARKVVKGNVTNEKGQPVAGASIVVKGTNNGASTDAKGDYTISVANSATLVISYVGYELKELRVGTATVLNAQLQPTNRELDQVIVVGYGTQKKRDVTGSVVTVSGATLQEVPTANVISELKGRAAGVDIVSNSATPGGGGTIRIRGNRSMSTTSGGSDGLDQPLLVVDGIPFGGSINDINPDDVQSLDILKDASATAIYGSRGSGGVILITTKRGRTGKPIMSFSSYYGISKVMGELPVFNGPEYAQFKLDAATYNRTTPGTTGYGATNAELAGIAAGTSTDWQKLIYKNGFTNNNQLSLTGGNEATQYGLSAGYYAETNEIPNQKYERFSLRSSLDHQINSHLKIGLSTLTTLNISNTPGGGGVPSTLLRLSPLVSPYNADGSINLLPLTGSTDAAFVNPLTLKSASQAILARTRRLRTFNSLYGEWTIVTGLKYRLNVGLDYAQQQGDNYSGPNTFTNNATSQAQSSGSVANSEAYRYTIENVLTYDKTIKKHRFNFTGLFSSQKDHSQASSFTALGVPADYIQNTNLALAGGTLTASTTGNTYAEQGLLSLMARLNYSFDSRFLFTATVRRDGASVLSPGHQYYTYPALSAGWNIMNEKFMAGNRVFSNLKLRGGWGITSNQGVSPYTTLGTLTATAYNFGQATSGQQAAYLVTSLPNTSLHWESTAQTNIGLDFGVLNNRITGSFEWYQQNTKDILLAVNLPPSNGAGSTTQNLGKTSGRGIEISLSTINIQSKKGADGFSWSTDFNFFLNREKIVQLTTPGQANDIGNGWFVGQPLTVIYDVKKIGIWQTADSVKGTIATQTSPSQYPGQVRVQDLNGDGKIDANDRQILGNFQPQWEGGFTSRMNYKNFDFSFVIFARMGMKVLVPYITTDGSANGYDFFMQSRNNQLKVNYWTRNNPTNDFPAPDANLQNFPFASTLQYQDGSFIKVRSINLGYTFPSKLISRAGVSSLRIYFTVENPFILYSPFVKAGFGPDPEGNGYGGAVNSSVSTNVTGNLNRQVSVNANNPPMRLFSAGINLKF